MFEAFKDKYTSVRCDIISKNGDDKTLCTECCIFAGKKVCDLINKFPFERKEKTSFKKINHSF